MRAQSSKKLPGQRMPGKAAKFAYAFCAALLFVFLFPNMGAAQAITGDVLGTVTDTTGAVVPNAKRHMEAESDQEFPGGRSPRQGL